MRIEPKSVPAVKLLLLIGRAAPVGKTKSSLALGATSPNQFSVVVQLLSAPPPSQVYTAITLRDSRPSIQRFRLTEPLFAFTSLRRLRCFGPRSVLSDQRFDASPSNCKKAAQSVDACWNNHCMPNTDARSVCFHHDNLA